ncbi:iron-siderophore ABC transporter substrate-binding protein [Amycolatopsis sp. BJA-103]|uniref:iron-siderophore ABC transporter substrate-binding protein n=1 Tax=Amycolatopsis sp. BJA-103 TaxID=1911175 RepID=UPI000C7707F9|nr:iron-siderophore ABC transporter substrate-binding protein [Amycolatopsis sp. BJA-103]AUI58653.1 iron ABC transporter substrate-binding protein [Amycolatopsis sp. BJA-103]PNE16844.1 iron ABC transporter substrate-binding protein [Amycolatopsis sp. BJA-103]
MARISTLSAARGRLKTAGVLASTLVLAATLTACGGGGESATPAAQNSAGGAVDANAFPTTIEHKYGSTTITQEPKRVVTVGLTEQDALLALGVVPVGVTEWLGKFPGTIAPWATDKLGGAALPEVLKDVDGPQYEKIAALKPDLIIALYSGLTKEQYDKLGQIGVPVVAQPKEYNDYGIPWQEATKKVGQAVGRSTKANELVKGVEDKFAQVRKEHPEFAGKSGLMASTYEGYFVYGSQDPRSRILESLGFKLPADLDAAIGDKFGKAISAERTDLLDRDALVWLIDTPAKAQEIFGKDALYTGLKVAKEKREILIENEGTYGSAVSFVTVLSLPYVVDRIVPQLAAAVDGDPKTEVKPAS